jgi:hypothetical protein
MNMKRIIALVVTCMSITMTARAVVTLNVDADLLKDFSGTALGTGNLVLLVSAGPDGIFSSPSQDSFFSFDDHLLGARDLSAPGFVGTFSSLFIGTWAQNEKVGLYWYDSITKVQYDTGATPQLGDHYGFITDPVGHDGGVAWVIPADGATVNYKFITADGFFGAGEFFPAADGLAQFTVVPEPAAYMAILGLSSIGFVGLRRCLLRKR